MSTLTFAPTVEPGAGLEPELALQTPREIPAELWTGSYARQAKKNISKLVKGGIIAIAMGGMSLVEDLASFFPLIEYSSWLGVGLLGVGAVLAVDLWVIRRRFRYVTDGVPTRVRIDDLALAPHTQSHGQPTSHRFHVWYSWRDPSNDETITCEDQSDVIKEEDRVKVTTSFRIGDEVTALHFKSNPRKTVRLYGFLGLKPDLGLVDRDDYVPSPLWMDVLGTAAIWLFIALTVWNVYALRRFDPINKGAGARLYGR